LDNVKGICKYTISILVGFPQSRIFACINTTFSLDCGASCSQYFQSARLLYEFMEYSLFYLYLGRFDMNRFRYASKTSFVKGILAVVLVVGAWVWLTSSASAQGSDIYGTGIRIKLNDDGSRYIRFLT